MAEAAVEPGRNPLRFFCHRCNVEFEDVIQNDTCPYCASGFIEQLDNGTSRESLLRNLEDGQYSDAEMSEMTLEDAGGTDDSILDESIDGSDTNFIPPMLNDLAFLMSGARTRSASLRPPQPGQGRQESLMEQLVLMIGGGRPGTGAVTAGAPFVLVGAPGDYVFGGEGLDAVVTQLLGQLENTGPPPLNTNQIASIPTEDITATHVAANMSCSVCWDAFTLGEKVSRLECTHIFHPACITPWLQLHATCPICRRSLLPPAPAPSTTNATFATSYPATPSDTSIPSVNTIPSIPSDSTAPASVLPSPSISRVVVRRVGGRRRRTPGDTSSSSSASVGGLWAQLTSSLSSLVNDSESSSLNSNDRYMDIDYD